MSSNTGRVEVTDIGSSCKAAKASMSYTTGRVHVTIVASRNDVNTVTTDVSWCSLDAEDWGDAPQNWITLPPQQYATQSLISHLVFKHGPTARLAVTRRWDGLLLSCIVCMTLLQNPMTVVDLLIGCPRVMRTTSVARRNFLSWLVEWLSICHTLVSITTHLACSPDCQKVRTRLAQMLHSQPTSPALLLHMCCLLPWLSVGWLLPRSREGALGQAGLGLALCTNTCKAHMYSLQVCKTSSTE